MEAEKIIVRRMALEDTIPALRLSREEGWNQTERDWTFLIGDPLNICLLAEYKTKVIGTTIAITYTDQLTLIGMVLVDKEYRGHGLSKILLNTVFNQLSSYKSIKLDATDKGLQVYKKLDFKEEYSILRMVNSSYEHIPGIAETGKLISNFQREDMDEIMILDKKIFGSGRPKLIEYLVKEYPGKVWCIKEENFISGFVLGRPGSRYHHIGPVLAMNTIEAQCLIQKALKELHHQPIVIDVPADKPELREWLTSIGFEEQRRFMRMYKNVNTLSENQEYLFAICGPEYG